MAAITRSFSARDLLRALLFVPLAGLAMNAARAAESAVTIPAPAVDAATPAGIGPQTIVLAGGCFWGVQAVFQHTKGVTAAVSGYAGGNKQTANYDMVGSGSTGHAESVAVTFDPQQISYGKILQIFYADDEQKRIAESYVAQLEKAHAFARPIVTRLEKLSGFYPAEDYHQDFAVLHPTYPYIVFNDAPKVENLKRLFAASYREMPVTVMAATKTGH